MLYFKAVRSSFDDLKFKIFQGYSLFSYQCSFVVFQQLGYYIITHFVCQQLFYFLFLKNFLFFRKLYYFITSSLLCQELFYFLLKHFVVTRSRQLVYIIKLSIICQQLFYIFFKCRNNLSRFQCYLSKYILPRKNYLFPRGFYISIIRSYCQRFFIYFINT